MAQPLEDTKDSDSETTQQSDPYDLNTSNSVFSSPKKLTNAEDFKSYEPELDISQRQQAGTLLTQMRYSTPIYQTNQINLPSLPDISIIKDNDTSIQHHWYHLHSASARRQKNNSSESWTQSQKICKTNYSKIDLLSGVIEDNDMSILKVDLSQCFDDEANKPDTPIKSQIAMKDSPVKPPVMLAQIAMKDSPVHSPVQPEFIAKPQLPALNYDKYLKTVQSNITAMILHRDDILYLSAADIMQAFHKNKKEEYFLSFGMVLMHEVIKIVSLIQNMKNALFAILLVAVEKNHLTEQWILDQFMDNWSERTTAIISVEHELLIEVLIQKMVQTQKMKQKFDNESKKNQSAQKNQVNVSIYSHPYVSNSPPPQEKPGQWTQEQNEVANQAFADFATDFVSDLMNDPKQNDTNQ